MCVLHGNLLLLLDEVKFVIEHSKVKGSKFNPFENMVNIGDLSVFVPKYALLSVSIGYDTVKYFQEISIQVALQF